LITISQMLSEWIRSGFGEALKGTDTDFSKVGVAATSNPEFGDYQCNDAMSLAKPLRKSPRDIAQAVVGKVALHESLERIELAGPGFINMWLKTDWLASRLQELNENTKLGVPQIGEGRPIVIDYSSPNIAKPMHIGHIRSTIIGNSLDRMLRMLGYRVTSDNHIGDWGTQFGIIIMGYRHYLDKEALAESPVEELERVYVKSYNKTKEDEEWLNQCRAELVKLQSGDAQNLALWKEFVELSLKEFNRIYKRLGVSFDVVRGESHYRDKLKATIDLLQEKGLTTESQGATVVFLEDEKLPVCIVRKSDGGFNYATTDIATVAGRMKEFSPERIIYVTDERQQLHFRQIFAICNRLGFGTKLQHVWFGLMRLPEGTFSTREGNVIKLERLLDEAETRALEIVRQASPDMNADKQKEVARAVGIGAIKYADLSQNPQTTVTFTWDKAMALDGNSGPYLQYTYARIASVGDKYAEKYPGSELKSYPIQCSDKIERKLVMKVVQFPEAVVAAAENYKPSFLADYLYDLAQTYNSFYQNVPFLKAPEGVRESRVRICLSVATVLRKGLELLGIETPERI
jgi:arginyl-tRNA synthetase